MTATVERAYVDLSLPGDAPAHARHSSHRRARRPKRTTTCGAFDRCSSSNLQDAANKRNINADDKLKVQGRNGDDGASCASWRQSDAISATKGSAVAGVRSARTAGNADSRPRQAEGADRGGAIPGRGDRIATERRRAGDRLRLHPIDRATTIRSFGSPRWETHSFGGCWSRAPITYSVHLTRTAACAGGGILPTWGVCRSLCALAPSSQRRAMAFVPISLPRERRPKRAGCAGGLRRGGDRA
jgi:hypothetical protein